MVISPERVPSSALYSASIACFIADLESDEPNSPAKGPLASSLYFGFNRAQGFKLGNEKLEFDAVFVPTLVVEQPASRVKNRTGNQNVRNFSSKFTRGYIK